MSIRIQNYDISRPDPNNVQVARVVVSKDKGIEYLTDQRYTNSLEGAIRIIQRLVAADTLGEVSSLAELNAKLESNLAELLKAVKGVKCL